MVVPARASSLYFKGKSRQIPEIARESGVRNILEGSFRKSGNQLRVTAQLVRADNGYHLSLEEFDAVFNHAIDTLRARGATIVDPADIPTRDHSTLSRMGSGPDYRSATPP